MISAIEAAIRRINLSIPPEILEATYRTESNQDECIDYIITKEIIRKNVKRDASLRGGKLIKIVLDINWAKPSLSPAPYVAGVSCGFNVFYIPAEAREMRDIVAVSNIEYPYSIASSNINAYFGSMGRGNNLSLLSRAALSGMDQSNLIPTPTPVLHGSNTIALLPSQNSFIPWHLTVRVEYDDEFTGMEVSSIEPFAELCTWAVKADIWSKLIFKIESNVVYRGASLGVFRDIVSGYSDAMQSYNEALLAFGGSEIFDTERQRRILALCIPRR